MKALAQSLLVVLAVAGCVTSPPATPAPPGHSTFTGDLWAWDEQAGTVTLRQIDRFVRVKVSPDQLAAARPRLHQTITVRGELAPLEIEHRVLPPGALVARGPAAEAETTGTVKSLDPAGLITVDTPRGAQTVWIGTPGARPFETGQSVRVRVSVQPLEIAPPKGGEPQKTSELTPAAGTEPGEYAVVQGRVTAVDPSGRITLSSQRGPVTIATPAGSYRVGEWLEVRTAVHPVR